MEHRPVFACERRTVMLLCAVSTYVLCFIATDTAAANWTRSLSNPDRSCLDSDSSDLERNCPIVCNVSDADKICNITAAVILPEDCSYEMSLSKILPWLESARVYVMDNNLLPPNVNLTFLPMDDRCSNVYSIFRALNAYTTCAHVFFGPSCEYALAPVGRIVKFWGIPLVTAGGMTHDYSQPKNTCDSEFHMLVSVGPTSFRAMSYFIISIMQKYNWKKVFLIYEKQGYSSVSGPDTCKLMVESLAGFFKAEEDIIYNAYDTALNAGEGFKENLRRELQYTYTSAIRLTVN